MGRSALLIGIDVGGTFTDAVVLDPHDGALLAAYKLPSTPDDPGRAVIEAIDRIADTFDVTDTLVCHGTTVGTNTLIERKGARTALLATRGFGDVIELRRQARPRLYDFAVEISEPLVARDDRFGVNERLSADGSVHEPLAGVDEIATSIGHGGFEAVAISFLHAYANPAHEQAMARALRELHPDLYVTLSSDVCPEFREYERTSTAVVNAYIGPAVSRYIDRLDAALAARKIARLMVVKSNGGLTSPTNAARFPVHLIESGPAAGLSAAAAYAQSSSRRDLIAFDMGGTTAKAGVIRNGEPETSSEFYADRLVEGRDVGGYAIRSPILDLVEIGAGGGSIARIDEAGVLKVGPRSAGADPGPACYGRGGSLPTVTDAHAVIGTLGPALFEGTGVAFDPARAEEAIRRHIAEPLGWSLARAAYAIIDIVVASMAEMVHLTTVQRGIDPRDFAILAFGGAGPLHAALVARGMKIPEVIVPPYPGMFSALGATLGLIRHEVVRTILRPVAELTEAMIEEGFAALSARAHSLLSNEPGGATPTQFRRFVDARFTGQLFELKLTFGSGPVRPAEIEAAFRKAYTAEYGFDLPDATIQVVSLRLVVSRAVSSAASPETVTSEASSHTVPRQTELLGRDGARRSVPLVSACHGIEMTVAGPAVIAHHGSTIWLPEDQTAILGADGAVVIRLGVQS